MPPLPSGLAVRLDSRGLVRVQGFDAARFLQGLITNDINTLGQNEFQSAAFLNRRGRVLFGALIHRRQDAYIIDVDKRRISEVIQHLSMYKLRAKVVVSDISDAFCVWSGDLRDALTDPRLSVLGKRGIYERDFEMDMEEGTEVDYERMRILNGVADGNDFDGLPLPLDLGLDLLNTISFNKGCYLGQELTARTHFTGVLRKRITPLIVSTQPIDMTNVSDHITDERIEVGTEILKDSKKVGTITSCIHNVGMSILRLSHLDSALTLADGRSVYPWKPSWWPSSATTLKSSQSFPS